MNFPEFKRLLGTDPESQDAEFRLARRSSPEFEQAAAASDAFEAQLKRAILLPVNTELATSLKSVAANSLADNSLLHRFRYALAATVVLAFSGILLLQQLAQPWDSVEGYVAYHYGHDGSKMLAMAEHPNGGELGEILASLDMQMDASMSQQVLAVKFCPTPEGEGVHLVMNTAQGLVTVIIMPGQRLQQAERFAFNGMEASLVDLPGQHAALAIVGRPGQLDAALDLAVQQAFSRRSADA
jgi:hypothetical protein